MIIQNITFNDHTFTVRSKVFELDGVEMTLHSLKDIENGWKDSGGTGKAIKEWKESPKTEELIQLGEITLISSRGANGGTWGCVDSTVEYAGHCSVSFRSVVRKTFLLAASGRGDEAVEVAQKVIGMREKLRKGNEKFTSDIAKSVEDGNISGTKTNAIINLHRLNCKKVFGISPKQFKVKHGLDPRDAMVAMSDIEKMDEYSNINSNIHLLVKMRMSYKEIQSALNL